MATEEEPVTLRRRRGVILGSCTRIRTFVENIVEPVTPSIKAQIEERKVKLDSYWTDYDVTQTKLEALDESEAIHRSTFEEAFFSLSARLRELLNPVATTRLSSASMQSSSRASMSPESFSQVRLPKLNLPTFSGKYDEWLPFFDTFNSVIHANQSLSNVQKLQYLRASLVNDASSVINALEISDANYEVAWNILKERYDNKRIIVQNHIKAILDLSSMTKENIVELRQIADGATRHIHALQALKRPTNHWDDLLVHILSQKLDSLTLKEWQLSLTGSELPTLKQFMDFIAHRCQTLEVTTKSNVASSKEITTKSQSNSKRSSSFAAMIKPSCTFCKGDHLIYYCSDFSSLPVSQKISEIRKRKTCVNCLQSTNHAASKCRLGSCKICKLKHNSLLHITNAAADSLNINEDSREKSESTNSSTVLVTHGTSTFNNKYVMLATAVVYAYDVNGSRKSCRVLLDGGSQANFISKQFLRALDIKSRSLDISISGVNRMATSSTQSAQVKLQSRINSFSLSLDCIVTEHVTDKLPAFTLKRNTFEIPQNLELADPQFHVSSDVDILIGAEHFWQLLCVGQIKPCRGHSILHKTRFGWVLAGDLEAWSDAKKRVHTFHAGVTNEQLQDQLSRFWQIEDVSGDSSNFTPDEVLCEQHFLQNISRTPQGRYVVKLPFKEQVCHSFGDSRETALKRFYSLERRFKRDSELKTQYSRFIDEYLALGHMQLVDEQSDNDSECFYLPHHCVFKTTLGSSKIRVVFDASSKGSSGISLNDALMISPTVQQDLVSILLRFRIFRFVLVADIIKMYRQVMVHPDQTRFQRILWRSDPTDEVNTYELVTVTYGTSSASYLATRCLKHLAEQYAKEFPRGSTCVECDFYVDDMLTGADTIEEAKAIRDETINLLRLGAFELSKWASNCPELLSNLDDQNNNVVTIDSGLESAILGIHWNQCSDKFHFSYNQNEVHDAVSKRVILSEVSRLFDPFGLLSPVIVLAKLILQELWQLGIHWDESIPQDIYSRWSKIKSFLGDINQLSIPRCIRPDSNTSTVEMHGFCDASQRAYGACIYMRFKIGHNKYHTNLLCSKSRVAPLKAVSLPRLELMAALLLARLIKKVGASFDVANMQTFLWSDATIVLNWIASPSRRWSVFVANRVGEIQSITKPDNWRHVESVNNPADILSRGLDPQDLAKSSMWWHGPTFLELNDDC